MTTEGLTRPATIIPALRYRDAPAAIEWLCAAFGFEKRLVVPGSAGKIVHAQLTLGGGMIMLASVRENELKLPSEVGGNTQTLYVVIDDPDAHCARARRAGARIVIDVEDQEDRGRFYSCEDPEGHVWNFGEYDPWAG